MPAFASTHVDQPLFECTVSGGAKVLSVTLSPPHVYYSFGPDGRPEIVIENTIVDVDVIPWNGAGRSIFEQMEFLVGGHVYSVYHALDRTDHVASGGVSVRKGDEDLVNLPCDPDTVRVENVFGFVDMKADAGICWDFETSTWDKTCN